jgi:hypothetical protein
MEFSGATTIEMDRSMQSSDNGRRPEQAFFGPSKTVEEHRSSARRQFIAAIVCGIVSFSFFLFGLGTAVSLAIRLYFGTA